MRKSLRFKVLKKGFKKKAKKVLVIRKKVSIFAPANGEAVSLRS